MRGFERALLVASAIALVGSVVAAWLIRPHSTEAHGAQSSAGRPPSRRRDRRRPRGVEARCPPRSGGARSCAAALQVFSSTSYAGATTAEIAREAGVCEPILYRHFASKRDLWFACLDVAWEETRRRLAGKIALFTGGDAAGRRSSPRGGARRCRTSGSRG